MSAVHCDVVQNRMLQVIALLAMEAPTTMQAESSHDEQVKVFRMIRALCPDDVVRGQFRGYPQRGGRRAGLDRRDEGDVDGAHRWLALLRAGGQVSAATTRL